MNQTEPQEKRVVIADDNFVIRFVLKKTLNKLAKKYGINLKIFSSSNGIEGVGHALILQPDLIIVDLTLPKYGGLELIDYLTTNDHINQSNVPIIPIYETHPPSNWHINKLSFQNICC